MLDKIIITILYVLYIAFWVAVMLAAYKESKIKQKEIKEND